MKSAVVLLCFVSIALSHPNTFAADRCTATVCQIQDGCRCSSKASPLVLEKTPQFVTLAFNDAVTAKIYTDTLELLLIDRTNADDKQVGATFYVPHEYTDYEKVNILYNAGLEIAVHSISKNSTSSYWQDADETLLYNEFNGQRRVIAQFANIPISDIVGARTPNLEIKGDTTFAAYVQSGIEYDNSWPTLSNDRYFPYTLNFKSLQSCHIGVCPTESFPGMWVLPIIDQVGTDGVDCNALFGCFSDAESADEVKDWLLEQFKRHYESNRAPLTLNVNEAFFAASEFNLPGMVAFLDELRTNDDVFLVSHKEVRDWMLNPIPLGEYSRSITDREASCVAENCELKKEDELRYMMSCTGCPDVYPWVGNPLGELEEPTEPTEEPTEPTEPTEQPTDVPPED